VRTVRHAEGRTTLVVPEGSLGSVPKTYPAFFNKAAELNRDITVCLVAAEGADTFCDAMSGVGSRGIRVANEVPTVKKVVLVDINRKAMALAMRSARMNSVKARCSFEVCEVSSYLHSRYGKDMKFGWVDLDPFGTPVRQIPAVLSAVADGGVGALTATDTAALCGVHPEVAVRRYGGRPLNNSFHHETGLRLLLAAVVRQGAAVDLGVEPVFAHATRHYMRVMFRVEVGATKADRSLGRLGFIGACSKCGEITSGKEPETECPSCGGRLRVAGPLWLGPMSNGPVVGRAEDEARRRLMPRAMGLFESVGKIEGLPPWSFAIDEICSGLKIATVPEESVMGSLHGLGFRTAKQPFEDRGFKTDAGLDDVKKAVISSAPGNEYELRRLLEKP